MRAATTGRRPRSKTTASSAGRAALLARWFRLTRDVLPHMAAAHRWPIHLDHCFMRVCLDQAIGGPWSDHVARPAVATMSDEQLAAAIAVAESIVDDPTMLVPLNNGSLAARRAARRR